MFKSIKFNKKIVKTILYLFFILLFIYACKTASNVIEERAYITELKKDYPDLSDYIDKVAEMDKKERRGLLLMVGIKDKVLSEETIKTLKDNHIMGVILFDYNIKDEKQLKKLTSDLRKYVNPNMLISIDQEGGEVNRIKFDKLKDISPKNIGDSNSNEYAYKIAYQKSKFLLDLGINMILGPLCDIPNDSNSYIYNRSFSTNINIVSEMVSNTVKAQRDAGIISVLKHFPGHGDTAVNSHNDFPHIDKTTNELLSNEFIPFKSGIDAGAEMVLVAHIKNKYIDNKNTASMSRKYTDILEEDLGFDGIVITDDLAMTGSIDKGINFGINLISNVYDNVEYMFKDIDADILSCARLLKIISENDLSRT
ncbi:glycoside hydrolase family 3 N-terminal domain-containing protein [Brachyspira hyodysenteriae]|uniref:glycoside hydrolase family 3 N-terminal domain-containing protein n=1 Tax=Brachyspira hyodysenteriae TaxID=159 RepID=UPI0002E134A9|nr:glycoside hydrolase family 3 N-terminal domain-containing protein [Brachyspira hyodysenteriae]KLI40103.1 beta-hexosaminidase [Brachyspira hyodysenteriae]KLI45937.1 beta-hexosaminidase [Brachyspira hyodysenteriae]KLI46428.1 beta-hexosaminidase [Brachyspira hyodysenteriae]KLI55180.1 beta-hexosaminidase [Brachyspira hyodysenteriae]